MGKRSCIYLAVGLLLSVRPALGHHAFSAEFDHDNPVRLDGIVMGIEWSNPHAYVFLDVKDAKGKVTHWKVELASRDQLEAQNWTQQSLRVGGEINVRGWKARNGSSLANADSITTDAGIRLSSGSSYYGYDQNPAVMARSNSTPRSADTTGTAGPTGTSGELPRSTSSLALIGLIGLLSTAAAAGLRARHR